MDKLPKSELWKTPLWLFGPLNREFKFTCDLAASHSNHLCNHYYTKDFSVFEHYRFSYYHQVNWCNPPYQNIFKWVEYVYFVKKACNHDTVMLLPNDTSTKWFKFALKKAKEIRFITGGRVNFINALTGEEQKGNSKSSLLVIFSNSSCGRYRAVLTTQDISEFGR